MREGLPAPGEEMGGWYSTYAFAPADTFGQWISALARMYAVTRDQATYAKIDRMIRGYAATLEPTGKFYQNNRFPAYFYDKMVRGLSDAALSPTIPLRSTCWPAPPTWHCLTCRPKRCRARRPRWSITKTSPATRGTRATPCRRISSSPGSAPAIPATASWRSASSSTSIFDPLARGENALPGRHAYSHMNALGSAAAGLPGVGRPRNICTPPQRLPLRAAAELRHRRLGPERAFHRSRQRRCWARAWSTTHSSFETPCGAYAHFKLARYLMRITGDSRYGDSMEQVLYNTVLGARPIQPDGHAFYYSDYTYNATKVFHDGNWPCCSGTLPHRCGRLPHLRLLS